MPLTFKELLRNLSVRCDDVVAGIATGGTTTTLVDARLAEAFPTDDVFNGGVLVLNEGGGNVLFADDCEAVAPGSFTSATVTDNDCKVYRDKTYKQNGKWSYKFVTGTTASDLAYLSKTLSTTYTTLYVQADVYVEAAYTGAITLLQFQTALGAEVYSVKLTNGALSIYNKEGDETLTPAATTFSADAHHRLEASVVISATDGQIDLWLDEAHIYSGRGLNTGSSAVQIVKLGIVASTGATAKSVWLDAVKIDSAYIGTREPETEKTITDYDATTGTVSWSGAIVAPTANYTRYSLYDWPKTWRSRDQKKRAINNAIRTMYPFWYAEKVDPPTDYGSTASVTTVRNQFHYQLPEDVETVLNVFIESESSVVPYWREINFSVDSNGGTKYLRLPGAAGYTTGLDIRLHYMARPIPLTVDNDELNVDEAYLGDAQEYVLSHAMGQLWLNTITPSATDMQLSKMNADKAEVLRLRHAMPMRVFTMRKPTTGTERDFNQRITVPSAS